MMGFFFFFSSAVHGSVTLMIITSPLATSGNIQCTYIKTMSRSILLHTVCHLKKSLRFAVRHITHVCSLCSTCCFKDHIFFYQLYVIALFLQIKSSLIYFKRGWASNSGDNWWKKKKKAGWSCNIYHKWARLIFNFFYLCSFFSPCRSSKILTLHYAFAFLFHENDFLYCKMRSIWYRLWSFVYWCVCVCVVVWVCVCSELISLSVTSNKPLM